MRTPSWSTSICSAWPPTPVAVAAALSAAITAARAHKSEIGPQRRLKDIGVAIEVAVFFAERILPRSEALAAMVMSGSASAMSIAADEF